MKAFTLFLLLLVVAKLAVGQPQTLSVEQQIRLVETSLMPPLQLADQPPVLFTLEERMHHYHVPAVSIAFVNNGKFEWAKAYGYLSSDSLKKADTQTLFQAASISKPIAALAALRLVEAGKLDLDTDVNTYLKTWKLKQNRFTEQKPVTLRGLLSHTAGLTVHGFRGYAAGEPIPSVTQILNGEKPANSPPVLSDTLSGSRWRYSGGGYVILQQLLEDVTGMPFSEVMNQYVLKPIGMTNSTYQQPLPDSLRNNASVGHLGNGKKIAGDWHTYPEMAPAGLWTTPTDLAHYMTEVQQSLTVKANHVLSPKMTRAMLTKHIGEHGLGPEVRNTSDSLAFSHGGGNVGFRSYFYSHIKSGQSVAIMTNGDDGMGLIFEILRSIAKAYGWSDFKPIVKKIINLSQAKLTVLAGEYALPSRKDRVLQIVAKNKSLWVKQTWNGFEYTLYPESNLNFFVKEYGDQFTFETSASGAVTGVTHETTTWVKIK